VARVVDVGFVVVVRASLVIVLRRMFFRFVLETVPVAFFSVLPPLTQMANPTTRTAPVGRLLSSGPGCSRGLGSAVAGVR